MTGEPLRRGHLPCTGDPLPALGAHSVHGLQFGGALTVRKAGDEFVVEAEMEGASARELNRTLLSFLLSALRKVEKRTTLRAEWSPDDGTSERFFDYVLKKTTKN